MLISTFQFINVSHHTCSLEGYPGAAFYDPAGRQLHVEVEREQSDPLAGDRPPRLVELPPGERASFITTTAAFKPDHIRCASTGNIRFTPPDDSATVEIRHKLLICSGRMTISPVRAKRPPT